MGDTTTMTIRIDADLKSAAERAAASERLTLTDYVVRGLKTATNPICPRCGRSEPSATVSPGFSPAFAEFYRVLCEVEVNQPFVLFTVEGGVRTVYWGRLRSTLPLPPHAGVIRFGALLGVNFLGAHIVGPTEESYPVAVPRGFIEGWDTDPEGALYLANVTLGYADGNAPARQAYYAPRMPQR